MSKLEEAYDSGWGDGWMGKRYEPPAGCGPVEHAEYNVGYALGLQQRQEANANATRRTVLIYGVLLAIVLAAIVLM